MNSTFHFSHLTNKISEWKIFLTHLSDENKTQKRKMDKNCKNFITLLFSESLCKAFRAISYHWKYFAVKHHQFHSWWDIVFKEFFASPETFALPVTFYIHIILQVFFDGYSQIAELLDLLNVFSFVLYVQLNIIKICQQNKLIRALFWLFPHTPLWECSSSWTCCDLLSSSHQTGSVRQVCEVQHAQVTCTSDLLSLSAKLMVKLLVCSLTWFWPHLMVVFNFPSVLNFNLASNYHAKSYS